MSSQWLLAWWNLIYIAPFAVALLYLAMYVTSGITFGHEADLDHGADAHVDVDADGDAAADADVHGEAALHGDAEGDHGGHHIAGHHVHVATKEVHTTTHETSAQPGTLFAWLHWLGVGRVPLSILLMVLLFAWGGMGFITNFLAAQVLPYDPLALLFSVPIAAVGSMHLTRGVVRAMSRWMPTTETYSRRRSELVGTSGTALYDVTPTFGLATVRDRHGDLFQVPCRTYPDGATIEKGARVLLVDYEMAGEFFFVTKYDVMV